MLDDELLLFLLLLALDPREVSMMMIMVIMVIMALMVIMDPREVSIMMNKDADGDDQDSGDYYKDALIVLLKGPTKRAFSLTSLG